MKPDKPKYKTIRIFEETHKELIKFRNLYSLQDAKDYSMDDIIKLLIRDRVGKQFVLPVTKDKKEALNTY